MLPGGEPPGDLLSLAADAFLKKARAEELSPKALKLKQAITKKSAEAKAA